MVIDSVGIEASSSSSAEVEDSLDLEKPPTKTSLFEVSGSHGCDHWR